MGELDGLRNWTVLKSKSGQVQRAETERSFDSKLDRKNGLNGRSLGMKTVLFGSKDHQVSLK